MLIRQLFDHDSYTYSYLLADEQTRETIIIDPVKEQLGFYLQLLQELNLTLKVAIDTHVHADHITALGELRTATGCDSIVGRPSTMSCASSHIGDGDIIECGAIKLQAMYTPGHTNDSYCFYLNDEQGYLFTGDTLLIRGTGRTDFQHGSSEDLYNSLFNKVLKLPENTIVFPGHDYKGWTQSTIKEEIENNPRLQVSQWQELAEILDNLNLPSPKMMDIAVPANQQCGDIA